MKRFSEFCRENSAADVASGVTQTEIAALQQHVATIDAWLDQLVVSLTGDTNDQIS